MRASGATNCGLPFSVVVFTNSTIAFLAAPSFQDGSGSVWAYARANTNRNANAPSTILFTVVYFVQILLLPSYVARFAALREIKGRGSGVEGKFSYHSTLDPRHSLLLKPETYSRHLSLVPQPSTLLTCFL